jgi:hypothetical protein
MVDPTTTLDRVWVVLHFQQYSIDDLSRYLMDAPIDEISNAVAFLFSRGTIRSCGNGCFKV